MPRRACRAKTQPQPNIERTAREVGELLVDRIVADIHVTRQLTACVIGPPPRPVKVLRILLFPLDY